VKIPECDVAVSINTRSNGACFAKTTRKNNAPHQSRDNFGGIIFLAKSNVTTQKKLRRASKSCRGACELLDVVHYRHSKTANNAKKKMV